MRTEHDFSKGRRGAIITVPRGKTRITIRIDDDLLDWFRARVHAAGGASYQALINLALRDHITRREERLEETLRRVLREELPSAGRRPSGKRKRIVMTLALWTICRRCERLRSAVDYGQVAGSLGLPARFLLAAA